MCDLRDNDHLPDALIKLGTYGWPRSEARQTLGHIFEKIKIGIVSDVTQNAVDLQKLKAVSNEALGSKIRDRLTATLCTLLDHTYLEWAKADGDASKRRAFVTPPMDEDALTIWAEKRDFPVLSPKINLTEFADATCVVVPRLERYFGRDYDQLSALFDLFRDMEKFDGRILVGCNSWAWRLLKQFDDALLMFGEADTLPPFDANALAAIFEAGLGKAEHSKYVT